MTDRMRHKTHFTLPDETVSLCGRKEMAWQVDLYRLLITLEAKEINRTDCRSCWKVLKTLDIKVELGILIP